MPDLRGPLGRHPENEASTGGIWIPACAGMTVFFLDWSPRSGVSCSQ
jgi:hypothetical protein